MTTVTSQAIQLWANENEPSKEMSYFDGYWDQIMFVRDQIRFLLGVDGHGQTDDKVRVVGTHVSKSIKLPVFELDLQEKYGLKIFMRDNFHDWKVSIKSDRDIDCDFMNLFEEIEAISYLYCEGMTKDQIFGMHKENKKEFTIEIYNNYQLYTFMWILKNYLSVKQIKI